MDDLEFIKFLIMYIADRDRDDVNHSFNDSDSGDRDRDDVNHPFNDSDSGDRDSSNDIKNSEPSSLSDPAIVKPVDPNDSISVNVVNQDDLYIPPLQQSLELLRKLSGIDSSSIRDDNVRSHSDIRDDNRHA